MKIQLDTQAKTIKLEDRVKLDEFVKLLNKLLPQGEWKEFTLEANTTINHWSNPVVIREYPRERYPWIWYGDGLNKHPVRKTEISYSLNAGKFNIEG